MKDFVSSYRTRVVWLVASMSIVWIVYVPFGLPWAALAFAVLAVALAWMAVVLVSRNSTPSIARLIEAVEAEPLRATMTPVRVSDATARAIL